MATETVLTVRPLSFMWPVRDPFLFCAHHLDNYPGGNDDMEPDVSLAGRNIGQDFILKDGWRMYHGESVPGFPEHPHRGFETVTIVLTGLVDHSDSWGQAGRYGNGDVQWMTAGSGLQHAEMFPLLNKNRDNPAELFQVWLNLPRAGKFSEPFYKMLWSEEIPTKKITDANGKSSFVTVVAGNFLDTVPPSPAPDSWAADPANEVAVWKIMMEPGALLTLPPAGTGINRTLYYYRGSAVRIGYTDIPSYKAVEVRPDMESGIINGEGESFILLLQGKPINEPVVQYGPFVMNTEEEIRQAFDDYRRTHFGGWPWPRHDMVHPREKGRFARYRDGKEETR